MEKFKINHLMNVNFFYMIKVFFSKWILMWWSIVLHDNVFARHWFDKFSIMLSKTNSMFLEQMSTTLYYVYVINHLVATCLPSQASWLNFRCKATKDLNNPWCNNDLTDGYLYPHPMILIVTMIGTRLEIQDAILSFNPLNGHGDEHNLF